jgi:hypothetical protein
MRKIREGTERQENKDGVKEIAAQVFGPFVKQRRFKRFLGQTVRVHNKLF